MSTAELHTLILTLSRLASLAPTLAQTSSPFARTQPIANNNNNKVSRAQEVNSEGQVARVKGVLGAGAALLVGLCGLLEAVRAVVPILVVLVVLEAQHSTAREHVLYVHSSNMYINVHYCKITVQKGQEEESTRCACLALLSLASTRLPSAEQHLLEVLLLLVLVVVVDHLVHRLHSIREDRQSHAPSSHTHKY